MPDTLHEQLNEALDLWVGLTGVDPMNQRFNLQSYHVHRTYEQLNEAQKLDPTGLTTVMLLRSFVEEWTVEATYSANDLLNKPKQVQVEIKKMRELIAVLERPEVTVPTVEFLDSLKKAVAHYEIDDPDTDDLLADQFDMAYLRRDAMLAIKKLRSFQFMRGEPSKEPIKYGKNIYQFWNINSLVREAARMPVSGVTLSLIRDAEAHHSYFVFAIRNGGNISVLTDKTAWVHPGQKGMSRRPDRKFVERAFEYHFPYNLMEFCISEDGKGAHIPRQKGLVRYNTEAIILGKMNQILAPSMVWLTMMLTLINDRYWLENERAPALAYTGEMAAHPKVLKDAASHLPVLRSKTLELPVLTKADLTTDKLVEAKQWAREPTRDNEWMVERYGKKVPEEVLNLVGHKDLLLLPSGKVKDVDVPDDHDDFDDDVSLERVERFKGLDPTEFGTRKTLVRDAQWVARHNQAKVIGQLAQEEYERKHEKVFEWFEKKVRKNQTAILHAVAAGEFKTIVQTRKESFDDTREVEKDILRLWWRPDKNIHDYHSKQTVWFGDRGSDWKRRCCITGLRASVFGLMRPMVPAAVAKLAGCRVEDLPWGLRRYYINEPYCGNSILNRIDPMDWVPQNPWKGLSLVVIACFTKRAFNGLRKELELPKFESKDWDKIMEEGQWW